MRVLLGAGLQPNEEHYRRALEGAGHSLVVGGPTHRDQEEAVVGLVNVENAVAQLREWRRQFVCVRPVLIGDPTSFFDSPDLALAAAPILSTNISVDGLLRTLTFVARGDGWLLGELVQLDRKAKKLVQDASCEWVRSRPGIIGVVQLARFAPLQQLTNLLRRLIDHAHTLLDRLPQEKLSVQDIWNVTLLIAVSIKESELDRDSEIAKLLDGISRDMSGSRKIVLWLDRRISDFFGPLGEGRHLWKLSSEDPLRRTLEHLATNLEERGALEAIFKRRLSQEDIDELLRVLSRQHD
jgi:hypothetical protein